MNTDVLVEIISALAIIVVALLSNFGIKKKIHEDMKVSDALQNQELQYIKQEVDKLRGEVKDDINDLRSEVREHNNFAKRVPVMEKEIEVINIELKEIKESLKKGA